MKIERERERVREGRDYPRWPVLRTPAVLEGESMGKIDVVFVVEIYRPNNVTRTSVY